MARRRGKVKLQYITDRTMRNSSQKMRLRNLVKKARELTVLCDVPACLVVYVPGKDQPEVWPSQEAATDMLVRYSAVEESKRLKYKLNGDDFVRKTVDKSKAKLYNSHRQNCEMEINLLIVDFLAGHRGSFADLPPNVHASLQWRVEKKLQAVNARLQEIRGDAIQPPPPATCSVVEPLAMVLPPSRTPPAQVAAVAPLPKENVYDSSDAPMTLDGEPRHGSYLFEVLNACDVAGDGSGLPTTEELHAVFVMAGILTAPQTNPSFDDSM